VRALIYLFHCLPQNATRYRAELARRGLDGEVIPVVRNGFSSVYRQLAAQERTSSYLDGLLSHHPHQQIDPADGDVAIVLASWSAGYGYPIVLLGEESSAERIDGIVFIDSCYSSIDRRTGQVLHPGLLPVKRYAARTRREEGTTVLWYGYADVPSFHTHFFDTQRGPRGNHMAAMLEWGPGWLADALEQLQERWAAAGLEPPPERGDEPLPDIDSIEETELGVRRELLRRGSRGKAVEVWQRVLVEAGHQLAVDGIFGPITARATRAYQAARGLVADGIVGPITWSTVEPPEQPSEPITEPPALDTVGQVALQVALELQAEGVAEIPGPDAHPVILAAFACCERGGVVGAVALQSDEYAWCAAFYSYCQLEAERRLGLTRADTGFVPRAAVWELHHDAVRRGVFHHAEEVRRGEYTPQPGDAWLQVRSGYRAGPPGAPFCHSDGLGHVGRVVEWHGTYGQTIDGNIQNKVSNVGQSLDDPALIGFAENSAM
jgi:hypothetical protein